MAGWPGQARLLALPWAVLRSTSESSSLLVDIVLDSKPRQKRLLTFLLEFDLSGVLVAAVRFDFAWRQPDSVQEQLD